LSDFKADPEQSVQKEQQKYQEQCKADLRHVTGKQNKQKPNRGMSMAEERRRIDAALKRKGLEYDPRGDRVSFKRRRGK